MKDFFVSYNSADQTWAEWIAWILEENGYTVVIQAWDFRPGGNFILDMQQAAVESDRTIMVLSENYLKAQYTQPEWAAAFAQDPTGQARLLLPIRVGDCQPTGMLGQRVYVDLVGKGETEAEQLVLDALKDRVKPESRPKFPDAAPTAARVTDERIEFPGHPVIPHNLPRSGTVQFVGRDTELAALHTQLHQSDRLAITAIQGMGGIGKTELALQYAYDHRDRNTYPGGICWLQAKEQDVGTEIVNFAQIHLGLTPPDGLTLPDQVAYIWQHWPTPVGAHRRAPGATASPPTDRPHPPPNADCPTLAEGAPPCAPTDAVLVIFDDVSGRDDITAYTAIKDYLPPQGTRFWVLLTTRLQLGASIRSFQIEVLSEGASLALLASLIGEDRVNREPDTAKALGEWLGYLPLGLELVGRFLQRRSSWSLAKLLERLQEKRLEAKALCQARPDMTAAHESVAAAFELSWQDLDEPVRAPAYRLCLYALAPIPWAWLEAWYEDTDPDDLEDWRDEGLINRSLLTRVGEDTVQLHQLIREFFRGKLEGWTEAEALKRRYCREMVQIAQAIPQTPTRDQIVEVTPAIPHLAEAATIWQLWLEDESLYWPFIGLGRFYEGQGAYGQAEPWWQACVEVTRDRFGESHPDVATSLNNLAELYRSQGRYEAAEPLYQEALAMWKALLGEAHPDVAQSLNNLAALYDSQGRYEAAEPLYQEALAMWKALLGESHPAVATSLNNLAVLYANQGLYQQAEPLLVQALELRIRLLGAEHPHTQSTQRSLDILRSWMRE